MDSKDIKETYNKQKDLKVFLNLEHKYIIITLSANDLKIN